MNSWIYILLAGIFEMLWVLTLKFSENFTKHIFTILTVIFMILSLIFLSFSFDSIPTGTAYACWTAIGSLGVIIFGMMFLGESTSITRIIFLVFIIVGIVGLKLTS